MTMPQASTSPGASNWPTPTAQTRPGQTIVLPARTVVLDGGTTKGFFIMPATVTIWGLPFWRPGFRL